MNATDKLNATATETLVRFLVRRFEVKMPRVAVSNRQANHGFYSSHKNRICVSRNAEAWVVVHEFAHHLDKTINGGLYRQRLYLPGTRWRRPHTRDIWHGDGFYNCLRLSVGATGFPDYPWMKEYRTLARWAQWDGLVTL